MHHSIYKNSVCFLLRPKLVGKPKKDLDTIGKIIRENQFDIIAIQEIYHKEALKELLEEIAIVYKIWDDKGYTCYVCIVKGICR